MRNSDLPIVVEQTFDADVDTVWQSITELDRMVEWYFDVIPAFEPRVGFETQFTVTHEGRDFPHTWKITEVDAPRKIVYDWSYPNYDGDAFVTFEIFDEGAATRLRLTCTIREDLPQDVPEFTREACIGGWEYFIQQRLKEYLEKS